MIKNASLLTQVAQSLEQNENYLRIKKLIYYVSKRVWETDHNKLNNFSLYSLIQELLLSYPDRESLKQAIYKMTQTLNKPEQYLIIANIIISQLDKIYNDREKNNSTSDLNSSLQSTIIRQEVPTSLDFIPDLQTIRFHQEISVAPTVKKNFNLFELRLKIITHTNPLKAKILLFSALNHQFGFGHSDWATLRTTELYNLLQNLTEVCKTFPELVDKLEAAAQSLEKPEEYLLVASIISQELRPLYT